MRQVSWNSYQHPWLPVTDAHTSMSVIIAFSRTLLGGYDSQVYIQERAAVCRVWGMGVYSIFMNMHVCVSLCAMSFNSRAGTDTASWGVDSVSSVIPVMSIKLGWLTGRVWDGEGGKTAQGHGKCQSRQQIMMMSSLMIWQQEISQAAHLCNKHFDQTS